MIIRKVRIEDAKELLLMQKQLDKETQYLIFEVGERQTTIEEQINIIKWNTNKGNPLFLVEVGGILVGFLRGLRGHTNKVKSNLFIS